METSVNNKCRAFTSLEQSKKLAEILPLESADMYWKNGVSDKYIQCFTPFVIDSTGVDYDYDIPCWNLAALLRLMPKIQGGKPIIALDDNYITYPFTYRSDLHTKAENLVDACVEMILKLHELKML